MKPNRSFLKNNVQRYALAGASFGLLFPVIATLIRIFEVGLPLSISSIVTVQSSDPLLWIIDTAPLFLGMFAAIAGRRQDALERTNATLRAREQELQASQLAMEKQVEERTKELTGQNQVIVERADQLKAVAASSRSLLSTQELDRLLPLIAQVISQEFYFYHVGIYLLDEQKQHAVLLASSSEAGLRIMQREQHIRLSEQSPVEYSIRSGQVRSMEDVHADPAYKPEPELPATHARLVLPLKADQAVIGALDLQSDSPKSFTKEYVSILSILADLVGIAIQNSILYDKTQRTLREIETSSRKTSTQVWGDWVESIQAKGYRYDGIRAEPLKKAEIPSPEQKRVQNIPIRLRGRTIGSLKIKLSEGAQGWSEDEHAIAQATAERAALALEGARLLDEAKKRAAREAFLSQMAAKLSTSFRLDSILRDTVEELGQSLTGSTVSFQLINPNAPQYTDPARPDELPSQKNPE